VTGHRDTIRLASRSPIARSQTALGRWIRECREAAGKSQPAIGGRRGIAQANITRAETGGIRTIATLMHLAAGLGCDVEVRLIPHHRRAP
jgi:transcriptional regulator with XRE-family HTH domain